MIEKYLNLFLAFSTLAIAQASFADLSEGDLDTIRTMMTQDKPSIVEHAREAIRAMLIEEKRHVHSTPVGTVILYAGEGNLENYLSCDGSQLDKNPNNSKNPDYRTLYSAIGEAFTPEGEKGGPKFRLPDFRGRVPLGAGAGEGLSHRKLGEVAGKEDILLDVLMIPAHSHGGRTEEDFPDHSHGVPVYEPRAFQGVWPGSTGLSDVIIGTTQQSEGASVRHQHYFKTETSYGMQPTGAPVPNVQPSLVLRYMIKVK